MINGINDNFGIGGASSASSSPLRNAGTPSTGGASFADMLKQNIDEVSRLQQDASSAVENLATGKTQDVTGVMSAMEKSDLAFKTLLSIRAKLMQAYDEIKNIPV